MDTFICCVVKDLQESVVLEKGKWVQNWYVCCVCNCGPNLQLYTVLRRISIRLGEALASTTILPASLEMTGFSTILTLLCN